MKKKSRHFTVLYTPVNSQQVLTDVLNRHIPRDRGSAFVPYMEYYRRSTKTIDFIAMFPGYVFINSDLTLREIHELLVAHRAELTAGVRELSLRERATADPEGFFNITETEMARLTDLDEAEESFLTVLWENGGLLTMSYGYEERGRYHVMEGPLKCYENRIQKVDKHNRKAFLDFKIREKAVRAGFECKPKAHWFPQDDDKLMQLADGTEIDLTELKTSMMTSKKLP